MFATSERVRPCRARCSARSVGRRTSSCPSSWTTSIARFLRSSRLPRGPVTRTTSGSTVTVTVEGTGMGFLPIRDIWGLPDLGDDLATDARLASLVAGHHAVRRGQDGRAHAAQDLRDALGIHVASLTGTGHPAQAGDHRSPVLSVLEAHEQLVGGGAGDARRLVEALDVALFGEDPRHLALEAAGGDLDRLVGGHDPVADPGQEVGDRVGHRHAITNSTWSCRGSCPGAPVGAGTAGRCRTCDRPRADDHSADNASVRASCTWVSAARRLSWMSWPCLGSLRGDGLAGVEALVFLRAPVASERHPERVE